MTILQHAIAQAAAAASGYQISRSLRFNSADSAYLNRTAGTPTNSKIFTYSTWVKRSALSGSAEYVLIGATGDGIFFANDNVSVNLGGIGSAAGVISSAVYRDVSAPLHLLVAVDTTQATASNRIKIYVNGVQVTVFGSTNYPSQNFDPNLNKSGQSIIIGRHGNVAYSGYFSGYTADTRLIDGQALDPTSFGEFDANTGVWVPKAYTGTYGTNGFWLKFDDNSNNTATTLGKDSSGNGNNWTPNNFSVTAGVGNDSLVDSPTWYGTDTGAGGEVRGNYATLNPLDAGTTGMLSDGNLRYSLGGTTNYSVRATIAMTSGKWYAEWTFQSGTNSDVGIATAAAPLNQYIGQNAFSWIYYNSGQKFTNGTGSAYGASYTTNDVIGIAFDADAGTLTFYKNGVSQGTAFTGLTSGPYFFAVGAYDCTGYFNFGQRPFAYTAPSGFKALCTQNLP